MGKKDVLIILIIGIFCACVFTIWKLIQIPVVEQHVQDFIFSNRSYRKKIIIEKHLMTSEQVAELFRSNTSNSIINYPQKDQSLYLVIRIKNAGNRRPWGVLQCKTSQSGECEILIPMPRGKNFENFIIPTCYTISNPPDSEPIIKWKKLYTYG